MPRILAQPLGAFTLFVPQFFFVPLMQTAVNALVETTYLAGLCKAGMPEE
jgi:hypothetical protein